MPHLAIALKRYIAGITDNYSTLDSPVFTGDPQAPTPPTPDNDTSIATTAFVKNQNYAPLASPAFTGDPKAPTPAPGDNDTSVATTAFVHAAVATGGGITQLTGDATAGPGSGSQPLTLATVNSNIGTWNNVTVNAKGLATAGANVAYLTSVPAYTGDVTSPAGGTVNTLATLNSNVGTWNNVTVNAKGLVTAASNVTYVTGGPYLPTAGGVLSGTLGVNTASITAGFVLEVNGASHHTGIINLDGTVAANVRNINGNTSGSGRWTLALGNNTAESGTAAGSDFALARFNNTGAFLDIPIGIARATGIVTFSQPIVNGSDRRLKINIEPVIEALALIEKLQGVFYKHKDAERRQVGLIAQDVAGALPEVVFEAPPDPLGGKSDEPPMLGIAYSNIVAVLIEAVKELLARVVTLEAKT